MKTENLHFTVHTCRLTDSYLLIPYLNGYISVLPSNYIKYFLGRTQCKIAVETCEPIVVYQTVWSDKPIVPPHHWLLKQAEQSLDCPKAPKCLLPT